MATSQSVRYYDSRGSRAFDVLNAVVLTALSLVTVLPLLYVLAGSFATESEISSRPFFLWPHKFVTDTYHYIFSTDTFVRALLTTICVTAVGTVVADVVPSPFLASTRNRIVFPTSAEPSL